MMRCELYYTYLLAVPFLYVDISSERVILHIYFEISVLYSSEDATVLSVSSRHVRVRRFNAGQRCLCFIF